MDNLDPVHVWQPEVQNDDVGLAGRGFDEAGLSGGRLEEAVPAASQGHAEESLDLGIVLDDEDDGSPA
jgi:hypothetical protein